jgi:aryl-alcohol dehydrogenase-like predicted oxidoreductase
MRRLPLGRSGLQVSEFCLGTMTWGTQTPPAEAHAQMDIARDHGVNFLDTAEMYPTNPTRAETLGGTEEIIGARLAERGDRDDWVIATKVTGAGHFAIPDGAPLSPARLEAGVEAALRRLRTDRIDLMQLHWPNRGSYHFRQIWRYDPSRQDRAQTMAHMAEMLVAMDRLVRAGKVRHFGLSNETAWGTCQWLLLAAAGGFPRVQTIQNEYSLLCRSFDGDMAEVSVNEGIPLLAYSPLANGLLTGKYAGDVIPEDSRRAVNPTLNGRITPRSFEAVVAYMRVARDHGLDPVQMALAWCRSRPFPVIPILGATTRAQLVQALGAAGLELTEAVRDDIAAAYRTVPMPY